MCGEYETEYEKEITRREKQRELMSVFIAGRRSVKKFSTRENEIFDSFYERGMTNLKDIAKNYGIAQSSVETYYDRMMDKLVGLIDEKTL